MFLVSLIFFYTFPASLVFLHGIGLERLSMNARSTRVIIPFILRDGAVILISGFTANAFPPNGSTADTGAFVLRRYRGLCPLSGFYLYRNDCHPGECLSKHADLVACSLCR